MTMKRVLITGANGLVGQKLLGAFQHGFTVLATARGAQQSSVVEGVEYKHLDITNYGECRDIVEAFQPDAIVNAAAFTHVDACEVERDLCWQANVKGVANLARAARKNMALLVHISTDYIFEGNDGPYSEDTPAKPIGYYGKSKLASENEVRIAGIPYAIIRTNVVYGCGNNVKNNFFLWLYNSLRNGQEIKVVTDQYNNPILADDLAEGIRQLVTQSGYGVYHMAGPDYVNRYEFAVEVANVFGFDSAKIQAITTDELGQTAPRPLRGGLKIDLAREELGYNPRSLVEALNFLKESLSTAESRYNE